MYYVKRSQWKQGPEGTGGGWIEFRDKEESDTTVRIDNPFFANEQAFIAWANQVETLLTDCLLFCSTFTVVVLEGKKIIEDSSMEVIGNIHEHPGLLEQKEASDGK